MKSASLLDEPGLLWKSTVFVVLVGGSIALMFWLKHLVENRNRADSAFFDPALLLASERLATFANAVGGVYRPGHTHWMSYSYSLGRSAAPGKGIKGARHRLQLYDRGASVSCSFRGWQVEVSSSVEELEGSYVLVPRVVVRLPPTASWPRLASMLPANDTAAGPYLRYALNDSAPELWKWKLRGESDRAISTLNPREQAAFTPLAALACYIRVPTPQELDVRARPGRGLYDETGKLYRDDFDVAHLSELVERSVTFAQTAMEVS